MKRLSSKASCVDRPRLVDDTPWEDFILEDYGVRPACHGLAWSLQLVFPNVIITKLSSLLSEGVPPCTFLLSFHILTLLNKLLRIVYVPHS